MKVTIDREVCTMCAFCWETCPEVFEAGEDGISQIVPGFRVEHQLDTGKVTEQLSDKVEEAAQNCPVNIIHVE